MHVQCNEAQCSQGLESISKCLNISLNMVFFYLVLPPLVFVLSAQPSFSSAYTLVNTYLVNSIIQDHFSHKLKSVTLM